MHQHIDIDHIIGLYRTYAHDLDRVREQQRKLLAPPTSLKAQLDDLEAEITYLLLREARPETVVEIGTFHGWSTTWILQALRDNGTGHFGRVRAGAAPPAGPLVRSVKMLRLQEHQRWKPWG